MKKVFKLLAYLFVSSIIIFSIILVIYRQNIFEYLNSVNNLNRSTESAINNIKNGNSATDALDLTIVNDPKFKKMQLTEVDLTGLNLSTSTEPTGDGSTSTTEVTPTFEVGNSNPFKVF